MIETSSSSFFEKDAYGLSFEMKLSNNYIITGFQGLVSDNPTFLVSSSLDIAYYQFKLTSGIKIDSVQSSLQNSRKSLINSAQIMPDAVCIIFFALGFSQ